MRAVNRIFKTIIHLSLVRTVSHHPIKIHRIHTRFGLWFLLLVIIVIVVMSCRCIQIFFVDFIEKPCPHAS